MEYNSDIHHRRSIRLVGYDYSQSGAYFITICTYDRECIFGEIVDREMNYNELGNIARLHWQNLAKHRPNIELDESIVMPNHLHGIIIIHESSKPISEIIRGFKTFSAVIGTISRIGTERHSHYQICLDTTRKDSVPIIRRH